MTVEAMVCCRKFLPTKMAILSDGYVEELTELGSMYREEPDSLVASADNRSTYILWAAAKRLEKAKMPIPPDAGSVPASEWLTRMIFLVSDPGLYRDFALSSADKIARQIEKKKLYRDFWGLVPVIYRYSARIASEQTSALFAIYRAVFRYLSGHQALFVALDKDEPVMMAVTAPNGISGSIESAMWPWDMYAFGFTLLDPLDTEFWTDQIAIFSMDFAPDESFFFSHLDHVRSWRRYTLTPGGVRSVISGQAMGIREILLKEQGSVVTAKVVVKDPNLSFLCWFDWSTGIGFSPWQVVNEYALAKDPLLGAVAGVFADLVTGREKDINERIASDDSASVILPPGDGAVKMRTVYVGRDGDRRQVRVKIPVERKAPGPHAVAGHLRKVRNMASAEAVERAREYGIAVPEGYTFIRPFKKGELPPD